MKIGVFVGSFNPVHNGHIKIVNELLNYLDKIIVVPTGNYWNKNDLIDIKHRINMWKYFETDRIIIDEKNNDLKYTYLILDNLKYKYPNDDLYLIIGADNIIEFDKWCNYKDVLKHNLIIINRNSINIKYYIDKFNIKNYLIVDIDNTNISSTLIRKLIQENKLILLPMSDIRGYDTTGMNAGVYIKMKTKSTPGSGLRTRSR